MSLEGCPPHMKWASEDVKRRQTHNTEKLGSGDLGSLMETLKHNVYNYIQLDREAGLLHKDKEGRIFTHS